MAHSYFLNNLLVATTEGRIATDHDIDNHSNAPNVALLVILVLKHFWSNVIGRAIDAAHRLLFLVEVRRTKIYQLDRKLLAEGVYHDVLRLQVPVRNILVVTEGDDEEDLLGHKGDLTLSKVSSFRQLFEKVLPFAQLHDHVNALSILKHFVQPNDIRVPQFLQNFNFGG